MKAFVASGLPSPLVVLSEVPEPEAGPEEVVVRVEAYSLNRGEILRLTRPGSGAIVGVDVAGTIVATTSGGPPAGTRIVGHSFAGTWAERTVVRLDALTALPGAVEAPTAATLPLAGLAALRLVRLLGSLAVGGSILIDGASGGFGNYFIQLASSIGARVTVVTASPEHVDRLIRLGATSIISHLGEGSEQFDVVVDSIGGPALQAALFRVKPAGNVVWMGQAGGEPSTIDFFERFGSGIAPTIRRFAYWPDPSHTAADDLAALVALLAAGRLREAPGPRADWRQTPEMLERMRDRQLFGKAVLTVSA